MASVYKRGRKWTAVYLDEDGKRRTRVGFTDKRETLKLAQRLEDEATARREGLIDDVQQRLAVHGRAPIAEHLERYMQHLAGRGNGDAYRTRVRSDIERTLGAVAWGTLREITADSFTAHLDDLRDGEGVGARTLNARRQSVRGFVRWCVRHGRLAADPLASVGAYREGDDRRRVRRAFTADEVCELLRFTRRGPERCGTTGDDRAMFYALLAHTGFRRSEAASLRRESFRLDEGTVVVDAGYSKRRRQDEQPLPAALIAPLLEWLDGRAKGKPLWSLPANPHRVWLRPDLRASRAAWLYEPAERDERRARRATAFLAERDAQGRVLDFHAFRHGFITGIVSSGAPVSVAQRLARHSTPTLTLGVYSTVTLADERQALDAAFAPAAAEPAAEELQATGTESKRAAHALRASVKTGQSVSSAGRSEPRAAQRGGSPKTTEKQGAGHALSLADRACHTKPPTGIEPVTSRLQITRSAN